MPYKDYFASVVMRRAIFYGKGSAESAASANKFLKDDNNPYKKFSFK